MDIAGNKIQLLITEEEADIIMQALQQYEGALSERCCVDSDRAYEKAR